MGSVFEGGLRKIELRGFVSEIYPFNCNGDSRWFKDLLGRKMSIENLVEEIPGADAILNTFGYWPDFHDAEILEVFLSRTKESFVKIHIWETLKETDNSGYLQTRSHYIIKVNFVNITQMELEGFNYQNVIWKLEFSKKDSELELQIHSSFGLSGCIRSEKMSVSIEAYPREVE